MSYILDALRRAEAERDRDRGQVPGLNAQPVIAAEAADATARPPLARWAGIGLLALAAVGVLWWLQRNPAPAVPVPATAGAPPVAPGTATAGVPAAAPPPPLPLPIVVSAPPAPARPAPAPASPAATPATAPGPSAAATPVPGAAGAEPRPLPLSALSAEQRRDWPPLALGGGVYSDNPGSRFVIIGGQLVREGDGAAPGVVVERIGPRSVTMRWRELRVELPY